MGGDNLHSNSPANKKYPWLPVKFRGQGPYLGLPDTPLWSTLVLWTCGLNPPLTFTLVHPWPMPNCYYLNVVGIPIVYSSPSL